MPTLTPQPPRQKVLLMLLLLLLLHPRILLPVGRDFEAQTADIEENADDVCDADCGGEGGEGCGWEGVEGEDGHEAEGYPGCLGEEGAEEFGGGGADVVEAGVFAVGGDAGEEVGAHW